MGDANSIRIKHLGSADDSDSLSRFNKPYMKDHDAYHGKYSVNCRGDNKDCNSYTTKSVSFSAAVVKANFYTFGAGLEAIL